MPGSMFFWFSICAIVILTTDGVSGDVYASIRSPGRGDISDKVPKIENGNTKQIDGIQTLGMYLNKGNIVKSKSGIGRYKDVKPITKAAGTKIRSGIGKSGNNVIIITRRKGGTGINKRKGSERQGKPDSSRFWCYCTHRCLPGDIQVDTACLLPEFLSRSCVTCCRYNIFPLPPEGSSFADFISKDMTSNIEFKSLGATYSFSNTAFYYKVTQSRQ